jgi:uncharacterized membrane protein YbhN (UPF0104 family)
LTTLAAVRRFAQRHRVLVAVVGGMATTALLVHAVSGRRAEFAAALSGAALPVLGLTVGLHVIALLSRSEAWHVTVQAAGGSVARRVLFRASSAQVLGSLLSGQLGAAARIFALRRCGRQLCPQVPTLIAAEMPILSVEATLAALASFTLVAPLHLPWWLPLLSTAVVVGACAALRRLARCGGLWRGLSVVRSLRGGGRVVGWVLIAVACQIARNWLLLHGVGVDASLFDATAVLIAVVTLGQLPVGPAVGAAAAVLILGGDGVAGAAAAGVLMTVTGTAGALMFALWAGVDRAFAALRPALEQPVDAAA